MSLFAPFTTFFTSILKFQKFVNFIFFSRLFSFENDLLNRGHYDIGFFGPWYFGLTHYGTLGIVGFNNMDLGVMGLEQVESEETPRELCSVTKNSHNFQQKCFCFCELIVN